MVLLVWFVITSCFEQLRKVLSVTGFIAALLSV
jgi:hypothetical protein